jgi:phage terminase large subunit-like protein
VVISTQASTDADLLSVLIDDAVNHGDPRVVVSLYTAPMDLDPFSEEAIIAANPAFGDFQNADETRAMAEDARRMPSREPNYRNLILNQRVEATTPFISRTLWNENAGEVAEDFRGLPVYLGLDLSDCNDLTALVALAPIAGQWHVKPTFWLPEADLRHRALRDRVPYDVWHKKGLLEVTPGRSVEYEWVAQQLREIFNIWDVMLCAFDRFNFKHLRPWLQKAGFSEEELERFVEFGQGFQSMSPALRSLESDFLNRKLAHGDHPVLKMCAVNAVSVSDPAGNRKLAKNKSSGRIDGMVALAMARGVAGEADAQGLQFVDGDAVIL